MLTCIGFGAYFSILLTRSLILSGSALVSHDSISYMSWSDVEDRKWSALTFYLLGYANVVFDHERVEKIGILIVDFVVSLILKNNASLL